MQPAVQLKPTRAYLPAHDALNLYTALMDAAMTHDLTVTASVVGGITRSGVTGYDGAIAYTATISEDGAVTRTENGVEVSAFNRFSRIGSSVERMLSANLDNFAAYNRLDREARMAALRERINH